MNTIPQLQGYDGPVERMGGLTNVVHRVGEYCLRVPGEGTEEYIDRKAEAVAAKHPAALVIASDQVAVLGNEVLGKPLNHENAMQQLTELSGQKVSFLTSLCLLNSQTKSTQTLVEPFTVQFRGLTIAEIEGYLHKEQPYNCAGSFKSEGLGITLFEKLTGDDPNTLIGLPLIKLSEILRKEGVIFYQP